ncbi:MAG TPA: tetratricopeptide repeat protein [Candidatus Pacearchaeota archaeon]|nr:tetratricopeptide repeat protein [Candidatus Pacearchaeota archaeon]
MLKRANEKFIIKDYKSSVALADKVLILDPNNYLALITRANSLASLNYYLDAIDDYEKAISIDNSDANTYGLLGLTYKKIGEFDKGQENLKKSIGLGWKLYESAYNMDNSLSEDYKLFVIEKAKKSDYFRKRNPSDFDVYISGTDKTELRSAAEDGLRSLESALSLDPDNIEIKQLYTIFKNQFCK